MSETAKKVVNDASSDHSDTAFAAVRTLKNLVIGSRVRKDLYVQAGAVPVLCGILARDSCTDAIALEVCVALGSFALGSAPCVDALVAADAAGVLATILQQSTCTKVRGAAARSLALLFQQQGGRGAVAAFVDGGAARGLVAALGDPTLGDAARQIYATLLARACLTRKQQDVLMTAAMMDAAFVGFTSTAPPVLEATLALLSRLCANRHETAKQFYTLHATRYPMVKVLAVLRSTRPALALRAAEYLATLARCNVLTDHEREQAQSTALPVLKKLLETPTLAAEATAALGAFLVDEAVHEVACVSGLVAKLVSVLCAQGSSWEVQLNVLNALTSVCGGEEAGRSTVGEYKDVYAAVVRCLRNGNADLRAAACATTLALSRSSDKNIKLSLVAQGVLEPLVTLIEAHPMQACGALGNLVLDCQEAKRTVVELGALPAITALTESSEFSSLGTATLNNLVCRADLDTKTEVLLVVTVERLLKLMRTFETKRHAAGMVRNLAFGGSAAVCGIVTDNVIDALVALVHCGQTACMLEALYALNNIATGSDLQKTTIMGDAVLNSILTCLVHDDSEVCVAAVWCVINLSWKDGESGAWTERVARLRDHGFDRALHSLTSSSDLIIHARVLTALRNFS